MTNSNQPTKLWNKDYILLLVCCLSAAITNSFFLSVFPVYVLDRGGSSAVIGTMASALIVASVITRTVFGKLQDKFGRRTIMIIGAVLYTLNTMAYIFLKDITSLYVLRFMNGITQGIYFGAAGTFVADLVPEDKLVEGIGYFSMMGTATLFFVPTLGSYLYNAVGSLPVFVIITITAGIGIFAGVSISPKYNFAAKTEGKSKEKSHKFKKQFSIKGIFEPKVIAPSLFFALTYVCYSAITNYLTPFGKEINLTSISVWFTFESIMSMAMKLSVGKIVKKINPSNILIGSCVLMALSLFVLSMTNGISFVIVSGVLFGLGIGIVPPILNSAVFKLVTPDRKGVASATYNVFADIGNGLGGIMWGFVVGAVDYRMMFVLSGSVMFITLIVHFVLLRPKYINGEL